MISKQLQVFGAGYKLTFAGAPVEVTREVTRLFNFGVITEIPEDFKENEDKQVTCNSYPKAFERGAGAIAKMKARAVMEKQGARKPSTFKALVAAHKAAFVAEFPRGENVEANERFGVEYKEPTFGK